MRHDSREVKKDESFDFMKKWFVKMNDSANRIVNLHSNMLIRINKHHLIYSYSSSLR